MLSFAFLVHEPVAQIKFEREYRITEKDVHQRALNFIDSCPFTGKIKWYAEESHEGQTIEAKTKHRKTLYSIEFDTAGNLLDVEQIIQFNEIEEEVVRKLTDQINDLFTHFKIFKTQKQWTGSRFALKELINSGRSDSAYTLRYEVELHAKKEGMPGHYQMLADRDGNVLEVLEILPGNTDNLEF